MTRQAFERQATGLLGGSEPRLALHSLSGHRSPARHQRNLRHARGRRRDRQRRRVHGEGACRAGRSRRASRAIAWRSHPGLGMEAAAKVAEAFARRRPPSCRARAGIVRGLGLHWASRRSASRKRAGARIGHGGDRLQGREGSRTQSRRGVPGFGSEHHPAAYRYPGDRAAPRRLDNDSFRLDAQPILPLRGNYGRPRFELLIRMLGDRGEIIPPANFLSSAERYQLMPAVDRWVVHRACEVLGEHSASVGEDIARFAINLSGQSLQDESFLDFVTRPDQERASCRPTCCVSN
jgi:hypothetical protein